MNHNLTNRSGSDMPLTLKRGIAACIDFFVWVLMVLLPLRFCGVLADSVPIRKLWVFFSLYIGCSELLFFLRDLIRCSIGKRIMGLRVVNEDGSTDVSCGRLLLRNLTIGLWPIEIYQLIKTGGERRLGDRLAGTMVIEI